MMWQLMYGWIDRVEIYKMERQHSSRVPRVRREGHPRTATTHMFRVGNT